MNEQEIIKFIYEDLKYYSKTYLEFNLGFLFLEIIQASSAEINLTPRLFKL